MKKPSLAKKCLISGCMGTKTTNLVAKFTGVNYFLPQLFAMRFANMGKIDPIEFKQQLANLHTFDDKQWCAYWNAFAQKAQNEAQDLFVSNNQMASDAMKELLMKAITYYSVSAWPGITPLQLEAYHQAQRLSEQWFQMTIPTLSKVQLKIAKEEIVGYMHLPQKDGKYPMIVVTNGLEGTIQEIVFPMMKYCDENTGVFFMEMPGTYAHQQRLSVDSEAIYNGVIEYVANHPQVDASRIAMVGVSFGGYWSARMAAVNPHLSCAVTSGPPVECAFSISNSLGLPDIMVQVMKYVTGAKGNLDLLRKLQSLSFAHDDLYHQIKIPFLIVNGDCDTLVGTQDSIELNRKVAHSMLKLYEDDDHCAMGHYEEWMELTFDWIRTQFAKI